MFTEFNPVRLFGLIFFGFILSTEATLRIFAAGPVKNPIEKVPPPKRHSSSYSTRMPFEAEKTHKNRIYFEENKGQVRNQYWHPRPDVLFTSEINGLNFYILKDGLSYQLCRTKKNMKEDEANEIEIYRIDLKWKNYNPKYTISTHGPLPGYNNYYNVPIGNEPALFVKSYENVIIHDLWPGVDLIFYGQDGQLKYDWLLNNPEALKNISFEVRGAKPKIEGNYLVLETPLGTLKEGSLTAVQEGRNLPCTWVVKGRSVSLAVDHVIPGKSLRIDPPVQIWGTYYGGVPSDAFLNCYVDTLTNHVYGTGSTSSSSSIATSGTHQTTLQTYPDAFIVKFNNNGVRLWGTYYGGEGNDYGLDIATDANGNVYFGGSTLSTFNISSPGAHQTTFGGSMWSDGFLVKLNPSGLRLWGTYYGGTGLEDVNACAVDLNGNVYIAGYTNTSTPSSVIATTGAHQETKSGGQDAYIAKFDSGGVRIWGTYYGGGSNDRAFDLKISPDNHLIVCGLTASTNQIATPGAHKTTVGGTDAFLSKFTLDGTIVWGTYVGGPLTEHGNACDVDASNNIYITGFTNSISGTGIGTPGTHSSTYIGGAWDAFLIKFSPTGTRLWGTFFGGNDDDRANDCTVDKNGGVIIMGNTLSTTGIATPGAFQSSYAGNTDAFAARFNVTDGTLYYSTYFGGANTEYGMSCATDNQGSFFLAGSTHSPSGIATPGSHQSSHNNPTLEDAFISKFCHELITFYQDLDGDGYGNPNVSTTSCFQPTGYVNNSTDCDDTNPLVNPGHSEICLNNIDDNCNSIIDENCVTQLQTIFCGMTLGAMSQVLTVDTMPGAILYQIRISDGVTTWYLNRPNNGFYLSMVPGLQYGVPYTIHVRWSPDGIIWSNWGPLCSVNTPSMPPLLKPDPAICGITMSNYPLLIPSHTYPVNYYWLPGPGGTEHEIYGATQYQFDFASTSPAHQVTKTTSGPSGRNLFLNIGVGLRWNHTYRLRIRSYVPGVGWSAWGDSCNITTPPIPLTQLEASSCGATITSITQVFRAIAMHQASQYEFKLSDGTNTWTVLRPNRGCYLKLFGPTSWSAGTYTIEVRWQTSYGDWSSWGPVCTLYVPTPLYLEDHNITENLFDVQAFPVPFSNQLNLIVETNSFEKVKVTCYDLNGRLIEDYFLSLENNGLIQIGEDWSEGLYIIQVQQGEDVKTLRVIKARYPAD